MPPGLPSDARLLLEGQVDSFEKLELLLVLRRDPSEWRTPRFLADQLEVAPTLLHQSLLELERDRLVVRQDDGRVRLEATDRLAALFQAYDDDSLAVVLQLSTIAIGRIRGLAARAFASAFVLREKQRNEDR